MEEKVNLDKKLEVFFHGNFIPLQGVEYIIKAAKVLENENVLFKIAGKGQTYTSSLSLAQNLKLKNIEFLGRVNYENLPQHISRADICLGIFGNTEKAQRVIPNKVYEYAAMAKPIISGDTPAIRELFINKEDILLCRTADEGDLAEKILELKNDVDLRRKIAEGGRKLFLENATPTIIGKQLLANLL